jgi:hypothetical protein
MYFFVIRVEMKEPEPAARPGYTSKKPPETAEKDIILTS